MVQLERAAALAPEVARYGYVYAIALHSVGQSDEALNVLQSVVNDHPFDRDVLLALATTNLELGRAAEAQRHAEHFAALYPDDPRALSVMQAIRQAERP